jgi:hypothetical protein
VGHSRRRGLRVLTVRALAISVSALLASAAWAEIPLYERDETKLAFHFDVVGAGFLEGDPWFGESTAFLGADTDSWLELGLEPGVTFETPAGRGTLFAELSGVYTRTFGDDASGETVGLDDTAALSLEQAHVGWKTKDLFSGLEDDTFTVTVGRQDFTIGSGLLVADGGEDGGERGGWYLTLRRSFQESVIVQLESKALLAELFRLENRPRRGGTQGDFYGVNVEGTLTDTTTIGGTYLLVDAEVPGYERLDVFSGRIVWDGPHGFGASGEYVRQASEQIDAAGWYAQASYEAGSLGWSPTFSYRYAHFDGDDPSTADDELFREIAYGDTDWGAWYQGEITGNYALGNGNTSSHLLRVEAAPQDDVTLNLLLYSFTIVEPASLAPGVTDDDWGDEIDVTVEWELSERIGIIGVLGALFPGDAAVQYVGGDETWLHSMLYASYSW